MIVNPHANKTERTEAEIEAALKASPLGEDFAKIDSEVTQFLATELAFVWQEFCERLSAVPMVKKLETGEITLEDYRILLINLRQQVVEGGRWIARAASSMESDDLFIIRSALIGHAGDEHRDFQMLEKMYVGVGGEFDDIMNRPRNIGSEALTAYMFHQANQPNPLQLFGAMFIIEGLGSAKAGDWGKAIKDTLELKDEDVLFMEYHSEHDGDDHYEKLKFALSLPIIDQEAAVKIVKTAKVVARLYCLQLEELDNY